MPALRPVHLAHQAPDERQGRVKALRRAAGVARDHERVRVGLVGGAVEDRRHRPHAELHLHGLVGGDLPLAVEREGGGAVAEERHRALVVDVGPADAALVRLRHPFERADGDVVVHADPGPATLDDRRPAELLVEGEEDPPRRHAARLEHEPGLPGLLLDRLAGLEQRGLAVELAQLPALQQPRLLDQLGVVVEDERVGVERDRVLAPARLTALPWRFEEALGLEVVAREQLGCELLEQPGRRERGQPGGVDDGDVGRRAADGGQRELRVVGVAPGRISSRTSLSGFSAAMSHRAADQYLPSRQARGASPVPLHAPMATPSDYM